MISTPLIKQLPIETIARINAMVFGQPMDTCLKVIDDDCLEFGELFEKTMLTLNKIADKHPNKAFNLFKNNLVIALSQIDPEIRLAFLKDVLNLAFDAKVLHKLKVRRRLIAEAYKNIEGMQ